jgi:hypothetical protein
MGIWKRIKQAARGYLADMEAANKKMFSGGKPDCCDMNRRRGTDTARARRIR